MDTSTLTPRYMHFTFKRPHILKPGIQRVQALADISRSALYAFAVYMAGYKLAYVYVVVATKPMHRLQIRPTVHNQRAHPTIPRSYTRVRAIVWECGR